VSRVAHPLSRENLEIGLDLGKKSRGIGISIDRN